MFDKNNGTKIIDGAIAQFEGIVTKLEQGVDLCGAKVQTNSETIAQLNNENKALTAKSQQANTFKANLKNMLTETLSTESTN